MKYIRMKDKIIDLTSKQVSSYEIIDDKTAIDEYGEDGGFIMVYYYNRDVGEHIEYDNKGGHSMDNWYLTDILKQADTVEELMMIDDLVFKKNGDIFVIANQAYIDYYIKHKSVAKLFIKDSKGNYIRAAEENEKGELELL